MSESIVFYNGEFLDKRDIKISPEDRGFLFGDGVYEVIKSYSGKMFEFDSHLKRLSRSLSGLEIQFQQINEIKFICQKLIKDNSLSDSDGAIYIQITRGAAKRKHAFPDPEVPPTLYMMANLCPSTKKEQTQGVKILIEPDIRWARCDIKSIALVPNVLATQKATQYDAYETVFIRDGAITEGASSNFFALIGSVLYTYPVCHYILSGITRKVMLEICQDMGVQVKEYPVLESQLEQATEMFVVSTINEIIPVVQYNGKIVGDGIPGPLARKLQGAFKDRTSM